MTTILKPTIIAAIGCLAIGGLSSCSEEAKKEAAAESAMDTTEDALKDYCEILESIKDEESARKAITKMDDLGDKFVKIGEKSKAAAGTQVSPEEIAKRQEKLKPLTERLTAAMQSSMTVLAAHPDIAQQFQTKSMEIAQKMQTAMQ